jgi:hypothetical protein
MATNPRVPQQERKAPQLVPNRNRLKPKRPGSSLPGVALGIIVALVLLGVLVYFLPRAPRNKPPAAAAQVPAQPVPGELQLQGVQLVAGSSDGAYDLDSNVTNTGPHSITGIMAEVKLRDAHNQVVLDVQRPLEGMAVQGRDLVADPLTKDPIKPNDTRPVRLELDNVPYSWNHNLPEIQIETVTAVGQ